MEVRNWVNANFQPGLITWWREYWASRSALERRRLAGAGIVLFATGMAFGVLLIKVGPVRS